MRVSVADRIIELYSRRAADWDAQRGRDLFEKPWLDRFLSMIPAGGSILDIGCGMGEPIASYFIANGHSLTGVDAAPGLIALCQERLAEHDWITADMRTLDLGMRFDGVLAWHSFFHLAHEPQRRMFEIFAAHAEPGAPLMFTSGWAHGETVGSWHGEPLYHASLDPAEYRALLHANGFAVIDHVVQDPTCGHATIWLAQKRP